MVIFIGIVMFWLTQPGMLPRWKSWSKAEWFLTDVRYLARGRQPADNNIVLVGVTDSSLTLNALNPEEIQASPTLQLMTNTFPWNRAVYAATLDKLVNAGAKAVFFDFVLSSSKEGDEKLAEAVKRNKDHVVLGSMLAGTGHVYVGPNSDIVSADMQGVVGLVNIWADPDDICRRGIYRTSVERESKDDEKLTNFNVTAFPDVLIHTSALTVQKFAGTVDTPPYDRDNYIDFQGPAGTYDVVPIEKLFVDRLWNNPPINGPTAFKNKIVIVGPMANILQDFHGSPLGTMPGPEFQAQMMATLLRHSSLRELSPSANSWLAFGMVFLALAICVGIQNALLKPALLLLATAGFAVICQYVFSRDSLVVEMMPPLFGFVGTGSFGIIAQYAFEQFERRRYRNMLDRFVSKKVAKKILEDKSSFVDSLSGRKQTVTVFFSDIRGFTTMTEKSDPEHLVKQLNEYFLEMVGAVEAEDGTLQKFIGDAIMAVWGDLLSQGEEEDARRAVRTALKMRAALAKLNKQWESQANRVPLNIGMGVNRGEIIVGYVGHPQRMEFTVLGDGVNQAARFESATKQFHVDMLVGETVEELTRKHFVFRRVGLLTVKGKTKPVEAFTALSEGSQPAPAWLGRYHEAIQLFRKQRFEDAAGMFRAVSTEIGGEDFLCGMYLERCALFLKEPPPADWNGAFVLSEK
jgi:adenylate cyclase